MPISGKPEIGSAAHPIAREDGRERASAAALCPDPRLSTCRQPL